jgi:hypothetical protein
MDFVACNGLQTDVYRKITHDRYIFSNTIILYNFMILNEVALGSPRSPARPPCYYCQQQEMIKHNTGVSTNRIMSLPNFVTLVHLADRMEYGQPSAHARTHSTVTFFFVLRMESRVKCKTVIDLTGTSRRPSRKGIHLCFATHTYRLVAHAQERRETSTGEDGRIIRQWIQPTLFQPQVPYVSGRTKAKVKGAVNPTRG